MRLHHLLITSILWRLCQSAPSSSPQPISPARRPVKHPVVVQDDTKYFHEPGANDELGHYDVRYYKGKPVTYEERGDTLNHLIRSYLTIFREYEIETWIAHGTLLGWWWNGKIMPWDWDLDTQVSATTLTWMAENMNMTMHNYTVIEVDGTENTRQYLLDVNPNIIERVRGDGMNVIDARWIDTHNGLFVDITGLAETEPTSRPGIWSCKNFHRYRTRDLYPLRETIFEGVSALVPYSFDRILTEEYSNRALTKTMHQGHRWIPEQKEWVKANRQHALKARSSLEQRSVERPHVPRSLQPSAKSFGLLNLARVFG